jgi:cell surface protein SprA
MQVCGLPMRDARGIFKNMNIDMRQYARLSMFIHAEEVQGRDPIAFGDLNAVVRIGNDFSGNYYEVKIPLKVTPFGERDSFKIWPAENNLDFDLSDLTDLKTRRNKLGVAPSQYFKETLPNGRTYAILGNPNLGEVRGMLLGVENVTQEALCTEVWFNELRLQQLDERGGWSALARTDIKLADLGTLSLSGTARSRGFGTLEQRVNERSREDVYTVDASLSLELGKLTPKKLGLQLPMYAAISHRSSTPEYDPYDLDLVLKEKLRQAASDKRDSIKNDAQDVTTIKTLNFTNVKKLKTDGKKPKIWSLSNFELNYSYIQTMSHNPLIERDEMRRTRGAIGYAYAPQVQPIEPFRKMIKSNSPWLAWIKDFNFNYAPAQMSFRADVFRQFGATRPRNVGGGPYQIPETYNKYFTFDRYYVLQWNLTRSISIDFNAINNARIDEPAGRIDTKTKKDSVRQNLFKGGRNTNYAQDVTINYNVPTAKIPFLSWTSVRASYNTKYNWLAASLLARPLGNTLSNTQTRSLNGELKFEDLYNKSRFLRAVYAGSTAGQNQNSGGSIGADGKGGKGEKGDKAGAGNKKNREQADAGSGRPKSNSEMQSGEDGPKYRYDTIRNKKGKVIRIKKRKIKKPKLPKVMKPLPEVGAVPSFIAQLATSLKRVGIQYTEDFGTSLPGYMDSTVLLGSNLRSGQPGLSYIFGYQPDTSWINRFGSKGLLSRDSLVSAMIQQRYNQRLNLTAQVTPFRDFNIDLNLDKTFDKQYSELYKDTTGSAGLTRLNPYAMGSFNVSYISFQTLFDPFDPNQVSQTFKTFEANRRLISGKLGGLNPYQSGVDADGYARGYGRYAQDVVIPAFLAAYTDKDPLSIRSVRNNNPNLRANPFSGIKPLPNWKVTYTGLSRIAGLDKIFTNFSIRHGYRSTFSMNSFNTALLFADPLRVGYPSFRDTLTGNFIPYFLVPNISIQEAFEPLIELDMTFTNQISTRFEWRKSRQLSLSLIDYQLAENRSTEYTFGFNWRKKGLPFFQNLKIGKNGTKLDNDVTIRMDFSLRDDATANSKLDQGTAFGTGGQKVIRLAPSIDYVLNNRVNLKLYFEQNRNIPKISSSFPITNTRGGVQVRISLAQ